MNVLIKALMASLVVGAGGTGQSPAPKAPPAAKATQSTPLAQKRVTVQFEQAPLSEVLAWLRQQGVNCVVAHRDGNVRRFSIDVKDVPVQEMMAALADAYGGSWTRQGDVNVLGDRSTVRPLDGRQWFALESVLESQLGQRTEPTRALELELLAKDRAQEAKALQLELQRELPLRLREVREIGPEIQKRVQSALERVKVLKLKELQSSDASKAQHEEVLKSLPEMLKGLRVIGPEIEREIAKALEGPKLHERKGLQSQAELEQMHKHLQQELPAMLKELRVIGPEIEREIAKALEGAKVHELKGLDSLKELKIEMDALKEGGRLAPGVRALRLESMWQVEESLTEAQRLLHEKQGHLKIGDLTDAQRRMIGNPPTEGSWSISVKRDGKTLTIRNR